MKRASCARRLAPQFTRIGPEVKLGDRHEGDDAEFPVDVRLVQVSAGVLFEEKREDISIDNNRGHQPRLLVDRSRRNSRTVRTNSSMLSSSGKNAPSSRISEKSRGLLPCSMAICSRVL